MQIKENIFNEDEMKALEYGFCVSESDEHNDELSSRSQS